MGASPLSDALAVRVDVGLYLLYQLLAGGFPELIHQHHPHRVGPLVQGVHLDAAHPGHLHGPLQVVVLVPAGGRGLHPEQEPLVVGGIRLRLVSLRRGLLVGHRHDAGNLHRHHGDALRRQITGRPRRHAPDGHGPCPCDDHRLRGLELDPAAAFKQRPGRDCPIPRGRQVAHGAGGRRPPLSCPGEDVRLQGLSSQVGRVQLTPGLLQLRLCLSNGDGGRRQPVPGGEAHRLLVGIRHRLQHLCQYLVCVRHPRSPPLSLPYAIPP